MNRTLQTGIIFLLAGIFAGIVCLMLYFAPSLVLPDIMLVSLKIVNVIFSMAFVLATLTGIVYTIAGLVKGK